VILRTSIVATVLAALFASAACTRDPERLKVQYVRQGDKYMASKKVDDAIIEYRRAVQVAPKYGEARKKLADAYASIDDIRNALPEYVRAADLLQDDTELQLKAGTLLLLGGRFQDAKTRARVVLKQNPKDFRALVLLGNALAGLRQLGDAIDVAERAAQVEPDRPGLMTNLGTLHLAKGERDLAEAAFKKAVASAVGKNVDPYLALANFYRSSGGLDAAEATLRRAYAIDGRNVQVNRALGSLLIEAGHAAAAEPFFKAAVEIRQDAGSRVALADYYLAVGRYPDAKAVLSALSADKTAFALAKMRLAVVALAAGQRQDAYKSIGDLLTKDPKDTAAMAFKARLLLADRRIDDADAVIKTALALDPRSSQVQFMLGQVRAAQNRLEDARKAFNEALDIEPFGVDAPMELARLHLRRGEIDTSIAFAEKGVTNQPENVETRLTLVRSLMTRSEDYPRAEKELRDRVARFPAQSRVQAAWGSLAILLRDPVTARKAFDRALELDPNSVEALNGLMALDVGVNRLGDAIKRIDLSIARSPNNPQLLMLGAKSWILGRDYDKAEQLLRRAIRSDGTVLDAYIMLGQLYVARGRMKEATDEYVKLASLDANSIPTFTMLGLLYNAQNQQDEAIKAFLHAAQIDPRAASVASNNIAWMYAEGRGNLDEALQYARYATSQVPENAYFNDTLGWVQYKKGAVEEAIKAFQTSVNIDPENATFQYHLGLALAADGDDAEARRALERALRLAPNARWVEDARKTLKSLVY